LSWGGTSLGDGWLNRYQTIGTVDPVPSRYQLGQELYLKTAPPAIACPAVCQQTATGLADSQHYGVALP